MSGSELSLVGLSFESVGFQSLPLVVSIHCDYIVTTLCLYCTLLHRLQALHCTAFTVHWLAYIFAVHRIESGVEGRVLREAGVEALRRSSFGAIGIG